MGAVKNIEVAERVRLDPDRLVELCATMGEAAAEAQVTASIEDICDSVYALDFSYPPVGSCLNDTLNRLMGTSRSIGLMTVEQVCHDIQVCVDACDVVAFHATTSRLHRVVTKAQTALWDLQGTMV